uniref:Uncharacterized protein n=1 Tax=Catharus ustulatus TaxID=91951 RepID=A0A8C3TMH7_CATUS
YVRYCSASSCSVLKMWREINEVTLYFLMLISKRSGGKKYTGPCGGRDCSGGCQCFPEKGSRVSNMFSWNCLEFLALCCG